MKLRSLGLVLLFLAPLSFTSVSSDVINLENQITSEGSQYTYLVQSAYYTNGSFQLPQGENLDLFVLLNIIAFANNVNDFHDIFLWLKMSNSQGLFFETFKTISDIDTISNASASWEFPASQFQFNNNEGLSQYYNSFDIFVGATFREDVSLSVDPSNDDRWLLVASVEIITPNEKGLTTTSPIPPETSNFDGNGTLTTTKVAPEDSFPTSLAAILIVAFLFGGLILYSRFKSNPFSGSELGIKSNKTKTVIPRNRIENQENLTKLAKLCPSCGTLNPQGSEFCIECGLHLK